MRKTAAGETEDGEDQQHADYPLKATMLLRMREPNAIISSPMMINMWPADVVVQRAHVGPG